MDGILNINKPAGMTSFSAVAAVKRLTGERRAGHAGTLDPDATGVLPIGTGKGTRVIEFLMDARKSYRAAIELGTCTDTYDAAGKITSQKDASSVKKADIEKTLNLYRGRIAQQPPMYSALKHKGRPLYALARAGVAVERKTRPVTIYRLELTDWQPPLMTLEIECSKGTYIRALANDIGEKLGCGAYLKNLIRTQYGIFNIDDAVTIPELEEAVKRGDWEKYSCSIDSVLGHLPAVIVDESGEAAIKTGNPPDIEPGRIPEPDSRYCRAYSADGRFLAILTRDKSSGGWRPKKVFI